MGRAVNLVVSCTSRKRYEAAPGLAAHRLVGTDVQARLRTWKELLSATPEEKYPAEDLYMGEHWSVTRDIASNASDRGWDLQLWICSAGYGLIRPSTRINSYQVTFASGTIDSVTAWGRNASWKWWNGICSYTIPGELAPRSLTATRTIGSQRCNGNCPMKPFPPTSRMRIGQSNNYKKARSKPPTR